MDNSVSTQVKPCRTVTREEVEHYQEFGWVKLTQFVDPALLTRILEGARQKMGEDADAGPGGGSLAYFNASAGGGLAHPDIRPLLLETGKSAKLLMKRGKDVGVRYYSDLLIPKLPSSKESRNGGNGPTAFHQDFITFSVDRTGGMTFWMPLESYGPDSGTMSFVNRSHRQGVLGDFTTYGDGDAITTFPELRELGMSEPMTYELGDITVHSHLTIHGAGANMTDQPRWAYILIAQPGDMCWNGSPCPNFDSSALKPWQPLDDDGRFPLIG